MPTYPSVQGTAHLFGVRGTYSNITVQDFSQDHTTANNTNIADENGNVIERRRDDLTKNSKLTGITKSGFTVPAPGDVLTFNSVAYEIDKVSEKDANREHRKIEIDLIKSASITPA